MAPTSGPDGSLRLCSHSCHRSSSGWGASHRNTRLKVARAGMPCGNSNHCSDHSRRLRSPPRHPPHPGRHRPRSRECPPAGGAARAGPPRAQIEIATKHGSLRPYVLFCSVRTHACYYPLLGPTAPFRDFALALCNGPSTSCPQSRAVSTILYSLLRNLKDIGDSIET